MDHHGRKMVTATQHNEQDAAPDTSLHLRTPAALSSKGNNSSASSPAHESSWLLEGEQSGGCWAEVVLRGEASAGASKKVLEQPVAVTARAVTGDLAKQGVTTRARRSTEDLLEAAAADLISERAGGKPAEAASCNAKGADVAGAMVAGGRDRQCTREDMEMFPQRPSAAAGSPMYAERGCVGPASSDAPVPTTAGSFVAATDRCQLAAAAAGNACSSIDCQSCSSNNGENGCSNCSSSSSSTNTTFDRSCHVQAQAAATTAETACSSTTNSGSSVDVAEATARETKLDNSAVTWGPSGSSSWAEWWVQMRQPQEVKRSLKVLGYASIAGSLSGIMAGMTGKAGRRTRVARFESYLSSM